MSVNHHYSEILITMSINSRKFNKLFPKTTTLKVKLIFCCLAKELRSFARLDTDYNKLKSKRRTENKQVELQCVIIWTGLSVAKFTQINRIFNTAHFFDSLFLYSSKITKLYKSYNL